MIVGKCGNPVTKIQTKCAVHSSNKFDSQVFMYTKPQDTDVVQLKCQTSRCKCNSFGH